jgi:hypothetical protein
MHVSIGQQAVILAFESKAELHSFLTSIGESMESSSQKSADIIRRSQAFGDPSESLEGG